MLPCQLSQNDYCIVISTCYIDPAQITRGAEFLSWICHIWTISVRWIGTSLAGLASIIILRFAKTSKCKSIKFANNHGYKDWSNPSSLGLSTITYSKTWPCYAKFNHMLLAPGRAQWLATTPHKHYKLRKYCPLIQVRETGWISHTNSF